MLQPYILAGFRNLSGFFCTSLRDNLIQPNGNALGLMAPIISCALKEQFTINAAPLPLRSKQRLFFNHSRCATAYTFRFHNPGFRPGLKSIGLSGRKKILHFI